MQMFSTEPYFDFDGRQYTPHPHARGPWGTDTMHGRLLSGLMSRQFQRDYGDPAFQFTRLTVDLFRQAMMAPVEVQAKLVRDGNRIRVVDGVVTSGGVEIARSS